MAISQAMHRYAETKLAQAAELVGDAQRSIPAPVEYSNFDRAIRIIEEGRIAVATAWDVDALAQVLGRSAAALRELCGGPAEASVNAAITLIDQAIGGETM
jgi:hypothetical protein